MSKPKLYLVGHQVNPQGFMVPIWSTKPPAEPVKGHLPGARLKNPLKGLGMDDDIPRDPSTGAQLRDINPEDYEDE